MKEICHRTKEAFSNSNIWFAIIIILFIGGSGILKEILYSSVLPEDSRWDSGLGSITGAIISFYPVLIVLSWAEFLFLQKRKNNAMGMPIFIFVVVLLPVTTLLLVFEYHGGHLKISFILSTILSVIAVWYWAVVNIKGVNYKVDPNDSVGGDTNSVPAGDTDGFMS